MESRLLRQLVEAVRVGNRRLIPVRFSSTSPSPSLLFCVTSDTRPPSTSTKYERNGCFLIAICPALVSLPRRQRDVVCDLRWSRNSRRATSWLSSSSHRCQHITLG